MFKFIDDMLLMHNPSQVGIKSLVPNLTAAGRGEESWGDQEALNKVYERMEIVYRCISFISQNIAQVKFKVFQKRKEEKIDITDDIDFLILQKPNNFQTKYDFWYESINRLENQGELFWSMELNSRGVPIQIFADWQSEHVRIVPDSETMIKEYILERNHKVFHFSKEEVFYIKYFNPYQTLRGLAPLRAARDSLSLDLNAVSFNKNFFKQGMKLAGILQTEQQLKDDEANRMKKTFESTYNGVNNMHKVAVLWGGLKFDPVQQMSLRDAEFMALRDMNEQKILYTFGLFPEVIGIGKATYENVKYYRRMVWTETLIPKITKILSLMNRFLLPRITNKKDVFIEADYSGIEALKEDRSQRIGDYKVGVELGAVTRNELRTLGYGLDSYDDPEMDIPAPVKQQAAPQTIEPKNINLKKKIILKPSTPEERTKVWHDKIKGISGTENRFKKFMVDYFKKQEKRVLKNITQFVKIHLTAENILFDYESEKALLIKEGTAEIVAAFSLAVEELMESLEAGSFDYSLPSVRTALGQRVSKFSTFVNKTTDDKIKKKVADVFSEYAGKDIPTIQNALKEEISKLYESFTEARAATIARTEVMGAWNFGQQEGMVQAKVPKKMWITSRDDRVRDSHQIDGEVVGIHDSFSVGMLYPHDFNERCIMIPVME